jgi:uncharacterized membrane protein
MTPTPLPSARLEALTDGIFAVTMTLLVLDVRFPPHFEPHFGGEAVALVDLLDNYVISFAVLAVFWIGHLRIMRNVTTADVAFAAQNLAFLLLTTLVPPLTALLGKHPDLPRASVLYGLDLFLLLCLELGMWHRVCRRLGGAAFADPAATWRHVRSRYALALAWVLGAIVVALVEIATRVSQGVAPWLYLVLLALGRLQPRAGDASAAPPAR